MIESMVEANGQGAYEDFEGLVLNGFSDVVLDYCGITLEELGLKVDQYLTFRNNPSNLNPEFINCEC